jgi:hypothetical protein
MPTNRAMMPNKQQNRAKALTYYNSFNDIVIPPRGRMNQLTARFSSFANTVQTRMNSSAGTVSALGGTLEAQVNGALSQVLRQSANGATTAVPTRPGDTSIASLVGGGGGVQPAMSPYQAALLREARITQADFLGVLPTLQPLSPFTDPGDVASLQAIVQAEVNTLLEEFSYTRLVPRQQRVRVLLGGLLGWDYDNAGVSSVFAAGAPAGDIQALVTLLNLGGPLVPTIPIEDQLASQQVLGSDATILDTQWNSFWSSALSAVSPAPWALWESGVGIAPPGPGGLGKLVDYEPLGVPVTVPLGTRSPQLPQQVPWRIGVTTSAVNPITGLSYAERMIQADLLMPVIANDASRVENSLTAIGFSAGEQETQFAVFWSAVDADLLPPWGSPQQTALANAASPNDVPAPVTWQVLGGTPPPPILAALDLTPIPVYMTVADILDWAQNLAGPSSADQLRRAGALGLNLICDQADELFWLVLAMLDPTAIEGTGGIQGIAALADTETQLELSSLATDLNILANLAY